MKALAKSNLWMPEIMKISRLLNEKRNSMNSNNSNNNNPFWDIYKKSDLNSSLDKEKRACVPLVKSMFVKDSVKYFYWNRYNNSYDYEYISYEKS